MTDRYCNRLMDAVKFRVSPGPFSADRFGKDGAGESKDLRHTLFIKEGGR